MSTYHFTDGTRIKRMLGLTTGLCAGQTLYDDAIADIQIAVEAMMWDELVAGTTLQTTYSERHDINFVGQGEIALRYRPVAEIVALTIGGQLQTENSGNDSSGNFILVKDLGVIKLNPQYISFPVGRAVASVTYKAGYTTVPEDLKYASNLIAVSMFNQQGHVGFRSERAGSYSYSMDSGLGSTIPKMAQRIIHKHRRLFARGSNYDDT